MTEALHHPICQRLTLTLLHFVWQGAVVGAVLWAAMALLRRHKAPVRYALSLAGLCAMGLCPVVTFVAGGGPDAAETARAPASVSPVAANEVAHSPQEPAPTAQPSGRVLAHRAQPYVLLAWLAGVSVLGLRMVVGYVGTTWLRRQGRSIPNDLARRVAEIGRALGVNAAGRVLASERVRGAIAVGFWRPVVLFPASWLTELPAHVLEAVIAHELAHVRRWDLWASLLQRVVETLFFYHPLVWWLSLRVDLEREMCCDDLAVAATGERVRYVTALESVARLSAMPSAALAAPFGGRRKMDLLNRVRYVLGLGSTRNDGRWWPIGLGASALPLIIWLSATGLTVPTAGAAEGKGLTAREAELMKLIGQLRKEVAELRAEVKAMKADRVARGSEGDGDGDQHERRSDRAGDGDSERRKTDHRRRDTDRWAAHREGDGDQHGRRSDRVGDGDSERRKTDHRRRDTDRRTAHREGDGDQHGRRSDRAGDGESERRKTDHRSRDADRRTAHREGDGDQHERRSDRARDGDESRRGRGDRASARQNRRYSKAGKIFSRYDANGDDRVSFEEWLKMKEGEMTDDRRARERTWYNQADPNGDGSVTFEEFEGWMESRSRRREGSRRRSDRE